MFPKNFSSQEEYDGYFQCKKKLKVGDKVLVYMEDDTAPLRPTGYITDKTVEFTIIGMNKNGGIYAGAYQVLMGTDRDDTCFWPCSGSHDAEVTALPCKVKDFKKYAYAWWQGDGEARIAKIIMKYEDHT